jgi:hypothetical protein
VLTCRVRTTTTKSWDVNHATCGNELPHRQGGNDLRLRDELSYTRSYREELTVT